MSNIKDDFEYEALEKSEIEDEIQQQKQMQSSPELPNNQNSNTDKPDIDMQQNIDTSKSDTNKSESENKSLGFFATLGLSWLSITNNAIGGAPIEVDGIKLMDVKSIDELIVNEIIDSGRELDTKYFKDRTASPEFRYAAAMGFFYMIRGRFNNVREWLKTHKKDDKKQ